MGEHTWELTLPYIIKRKYGNSVEEQERTRGSAGPPRPPWHHSLGPAVVGVTRHVRVFRLALKGKQRNQGKHYSA